MQCVEIFCGGGGLALGLQRAGFHHVLAVDSDKQACATFEANFPGVRVLHADVAKVDWTAAARGVVDLVAGGPPCQPFSSAGKQKGASDTRDGWGLAVATVAAVAPRAFLFENVRGFLSSKFDAYREDICGRLRALGYAVHVTKVNAAHYGVPQNRHRVFVTGIKLPTPGAPAPTSSWRAPRPRATRVSAWQAIKDLGQPFADASAEANDHVFRGGAREYPPKHTATLWSKPAKTVVRGTHGPAGGANILKLPDGTVRWFTVRELARLQTFPDTFRLPPTWTHATGVLGNAVPPLLGEAFGRSVAHALECVEAVQDDAVP